MAGVDALNRDVDVDLSGIFASIWKNKFKLLIASLVVTGIVFVLLQVISPRYRSEASILIRPSDSVLANSNNNQGQNQTDLDEQGIASQVQLLQSRTIAREVITELNLTNNPEFETSLNRSALDTLFSVVGLVDGGNGVTAEDRVLESYFSKLKVFQADRARVIVVQFWSKDNELAAAIPNMIVKKFIELQEKLKRGADPAELARLEPELATLRESVMMAEAKVANFRAESDLLQGRDNSSLATQELSELATELGRVRAQRSRAEANAASVRRALESGALDAAASVLESPLIQRLRERQVNLNTQLAEASTTLLAAHPRIQRLRSQISTLTSQLNREARKIQASLQQEASIARSRERDLVEQRNTLKSEAGRVGKEQVELRSLEREADVQRRLLNDFMVGLQEAKSRQNREFLPADAFVFSTAQVQSKPYFPKKIPTLTGAFFGTFMLGAMFVLAASILTSNSSREHYLQDYAEMRKTEDNTSPFSFEEYEQQLQHNLGNSAPPLAPELQDLTKDEPSEDESASASIAAKSLMMLGSSRVAVLSPEGEKGSEGTVILARYLASQGASVILVDLTGKASATELMLSQRNSLGLKDLMAGTASFADTIHSDRISAAHIMPSGIADSMAAAANSAQLPEFLAALQNTYNFVVIDCGAAEVSGLRRVSDPSTVNIISASAPLNPAVRLASEMLIHSGFRAPLVIHANLDERKLMGLVAA